MFLSVLDLSARVFTCHLAVKSDTKFKLGARHAHPLDPKSSNNKGDVYIQFFDLDVARSEQFASTVVPACGRFRQIGLMLRRLRTGSEFMVLRLPSRQPRVRSPHGSQNFLLASCYQNQGANLEYTPRYNQSTDFPPSLEAYVLPRVLEAVEQGYGRGPSSRLATSWNALQYL